MPAFYLVDVPGLGYAEVRYFSKYYFSLPFVATNSSSPIVHPPRRRRPCHQANEGTQDSWRSLLERYLSVRDPLAAVFHLVDSRHQLTATDKMVRVYCCATAHTCICVHGIDFGAHLVANVVR